MIGIYKIINPKDKVYIGKSKNIEKRFKYYKRLDCKSQIKIYNSLAKYGPENHTFKIIEECSISQLDEKEIYWINLFNSIKYGLNLTEGGDGGKRSKESEELRRSNSMKPILQYDLEGNFIKEWKGASDAIKQFEKGNANNINDCARGKYLSTYGFIWVYKTNNIFPLKISPYKTNQGNRNKWNNLTREKIKESRKGEKRSREYAEKISKIKMKPIFQYNKNGELIEIFPSFKSFDNSGIIGTTKLRKIINKDIYYKGYKYTNK
jgi:group I intron endonuclease